MCIFTESTTKESTNNFHNRSKIKAGPRVVFHTVFRVEKIEGIKICFFDAIEPKIFMRYSADFHVKNTTPVNHYDYQYSGTQKSFSLVQLA